MPLEQPFGIVLLNEAVNGEARLLQRAEPGHVEALLLERVHEALDQPVALGVADVRERVADAQPLRLGVELTRRVALAPQSCRSPSPNVGVKPPKCRRTPWQRGSSAAQRFPLLTEWWPTISSVQWSLAPKNQHHPSSSVQNHVASVLHIRSGRSARMVPLCV